MSIINNKALKERILDIYDTFDKGHNRVHVLEVIEASMALAKNFEVNDEMVYVAALYHDIGIAQDRATHHLISAQIFVNDTEVTRYFTEEQISIIAEAIEDHRASSKTEPRSIYGKILSSADRIIEPDTIILRSYYHSKKHFPNHSFTEHINIIYEHVINKYGEDGYLRIPILTPKNESALARLRQLVAHENQFKSYATQVINKGEL